MGKRVNTTKKEREALLKELGYTEADMQGFWDENVGVNRVITMLNDSGKTWKDLCVHQMRGLPTLKEVTLSKLKEKEQKEKEKAELEEKIRQDKEYYNNHFEEIMANKIDAGEELTEKELDRLTYGNYVVDEIEGDNGRWSRSVKTIVNLCGKHYAINWEQGLTECQENSFMNQPYEVELQAYKKLVDVKEWYKKGEPAPLKPNEYISQNDNAESIIDKVTEFMYCNYGDCCMKENMTVQELENIRKIIKDNLL